MKIAVLMSTYNGEKYIREQIESIRSQTTNAQVDIVVRDDGSNDGTLDILTEYNIKYYTGENLGPAKSFFDLIKHTSGYDYYAFADQDDYWMEDKLQAGIDVLKDMDGPAMMYSNPLLVNEKLESLGRVLYKNIPKTNMETVICVGNIIGCTIMFNEALAEKIRARKLPEKIRMHDYYVAAVCVSIGGQVIYDDHAYMKYRQHGNNTEGVPVSRSQTVSSRIDEIKTRSAVSIADQAMEILKEYEADLIEESRRWLYKVAHYRKSIFSRVALAISGKTHYITLNKSISVRSTIFLGNR